jgi:hypothetical protein
MMIHCPECRKEISDSATACIGCGRPMKENRTVPVEQTGKTWKGIRLIGALLTFGPFFLLFSGQGYDPGNLGTMTVVGIVTWVVGAIGSYWYHG